MARTGLNEELCDLAITAEKKMGEFYLGLMKKFSYSDVSKWFRTLARHEVAHMKMVGTIINSMNPEQLYAPANPDLIKEARDYIKIPVDDELDAIDTLEDAYKKIRELEYSSEINVVYSFLLSEFVSAEQKQKRLQQLKSHLRKIDEFPSQFLDVNGPNYKLRATQPRTGKCPSCQKPIAPDFKICPYCAQSLISSSF
jgi:rubrerythrin